MTWPPCSATGNPFLTSDNTLSHDIRIESKLVPFFPFFDSNFSWNTAEARNVESNSNRPVSEPVSSFGRGVAILLSSSWNIQFSRMKAHAYLERDKFPDCVCKRCVCRRFSTHLSRPNISSNTSDREKNVKEKRRRRRRKEIVSNCPKCFSNLFLSLWVQE